MDKHYFIVIFLLTFTSLFGQNKEYEEYQKLEKQVKVLEEERQVLANNFEGHYCPNYAPEWAEYNNSNMYMPKTRQETQKQIDYLKNLKNKYLGSNGAVSKIHSDEAKMKSVDDEIDVIEEKIFKYPYRSRNTAFPRGLTQDFCTYLIRDIDEKIGRLEYHLNGLPKEFSENSTEQNQTMSDGNVAEVVSNSNNSNQSSNSNNSSYSGYQPKSEAQMRQELNESIDNASRNIASLFANEGDKFIGEKMADKSKQNKQKVKDYNNYVADLKVVLKEKQLSYDRMLSDNQSIQKIIDVSQHYSIGKCPNQLCRIGYVPVKKICDVCEGKGFNISKGTKLSGFTKSTITTHQECWECKGSGVTQLYEESQDNICYRCNGYYDNVYIYKGNSKTAFTEELPIFKPNIIRQVLDLKKGFQQQPDAQFHYIETKNDELIFLDRNFKIYSPDNEAEIRKAFKEHKNEAKKSSEEIAEYLKNFIHNKTIDSKNIQTTNKTKYVVDKSEIIDVKTRVYREPFQTNNGVAIIAYFIKRKGSTNKEVIAFYCEYNFEPSLKILKYDEIQIVSEKEYEKYMRR